MTHQSQRSKQFAPAAVPFGKLKLLCARFSLRAGLAVLALSQLLTGCASSMDSAAKLLPPVGPSSPAAAATPAIGSLVVHTAAQEYFEGGLARYPLTGYEIHTGDGALFQNVRNRLGNGDEAPSTVLLPEGRYFILADSQIYGRVKVPVVIARNRTTEIDLNRRAPSSPTQGVPFPADGPQAF